MKNSIFLVLLLNWLSSCSQSQNVAGEYEKVSESGSVEFLLKLNPDGTFQFDSYSVRQIDGAVLNINSKKTLPTGIGLSGKGTWSEERNVIHFKTNPTIDISYKNTLDFNATRAMFVLESSIKLLKEKELAEIDFFDSEIFWIEGLELIKRN